MVPSRADRQIPNSYLMELITIHLWENNQTETGRFDTLKAFHRVMKALQDYKSLNAVWSTNYSQAMIPNKVKKRYRSYQNIQIYAATLPARVELMLLIAPKTPQPPPRLSSLRSSLEEETAVNASHVASRFLKPFLSGSQNLGAI